MRHHTPSPTARREKSPVDHVAATVRRLTAGYSQGVMVVSVWYFLCNLQGVSEKMIHSENELLRILDIVMLLL